MAVTAFFPYHAKYRSFFNAEFPVLLPHATLVPLGRLQEISTMFHPAKLAGDVFLLCVDGAQVRISVPLTFTMTCFIPSLVRLP